MIMINHALNYLSTAIFRSTGCNYFLCVKVSEACFYRNMHDLLHTSTSCHFKICLKSHTTGTTAQRDPTVAFWGTVLFDVFAEDGTRDRCTTA